MRFLITCSPRKDIFVIYFFKYSAFSNEEKTKMQLLFISIKHTNQL